MIKSSEAEEAAITDPASVDWDFAPAMMPVTIDSCGATMNGIIYTCQGRGPHPAVILLHGYPGNERNLDLAQAMRRAGWNVLFFHYRGAWGSGGTFSLDNALQDVYAAIDFMRAPDSQRNYRIDSSQITLAGFCMGGYLALMAGAQRAFIHRIIALAASNAAQLIRMTASDPALANQIVAALDNEPSIKGANWREILSKVGSDLTHYDLLEQVAYLDGKTLLIVGAARDEEAPLDQYYLPLVERLKERGKAHVTEMIFDTDHTFSSRRICLARLIIRWLADAPH